MVSTAFSIKVNKYLTNSHNNLHLHEASYILSWVLGC